MKKIAVLGDGSWGTALSMVLNDSGQDVRLCTHREAQEEEINQQHKNKSYVSVYFTEKIIAVLGAGSWGTALSMVLHDSGQDVRLWTHREAQAEEINQQHTNKSYVSVDLPEGIIAYHDLKAAIKDTDAILFVVPSKAVR